MKFDSFLKINEIKLSKETWKFTCPCCGFPTLSERGGYDICILCNWEDDGQDDKDADAVLGGPNGDLSLTQARDNFQKFSSSGGKATHDDPYSEVKDGLIGYFHELLSKKPSTELINKIDGCLKEYYAIMDKEHKKYEESFKKKSS